MDLVKYINICPNDENKYWVWDASQVHMLKVQHINDSVGEGTFFFSTCDFMCMYIERVTAQ